MKELTKAEEQVMQILWDMRKGFVKDIIEDFDDPKPAYNTVSTICRILEKKEFLGYKSYGNSHQYFPLITREEYTKLYVNNVVKNYFSSSFRQMVSFFSKQNEIDINDADEIIRMMEEIKKSKQ